MSAEDNLRRVKLGFDAVNEHHIDAFIDLLDPEFRFQMVMRPQMLQTGGTINGPEGLRHYLNLFLTGFPDFHLEEISLRASGNMVYYEVIAHGTHTQGIPIPNSITIPATGQRVKIPVEVYHTFDTAGRYISTTVHVDIVDVIKQIGNR
jgi:predicted ester cyclase